MLRKFFALVLYGGLIAILQCASGNVSSNLPTINPGVINQNAINKGAMNQRIYPSSVNQAAKQYATSTINTNTNLAIDFDISLGARDPEFRNFYLDFMKKLNKPKSDWLKYMRKVDPQNFLSTLRNTYNERKLGIIHDNFVPQTTRIPRVFHQIWIGPKPLPEKYKRWQKTWQSIPGWTYKLWTDKDVQQFPLINQDAYYREKNLGARADILRLEILYREGGVYIDTDFECLKPNLFAILASEYDFFAGITPLDGPS